MNQDLLRNRKTFLFLDQDTELIQILSAYLGIEGYRTLHCDSIKMANKKVDNQKFEMILVDPLGFEDGFEDFIERCRQPGHINHATAFILMSHTLSTPIDLRLKTAVSFVLPKPFELESLMGVIAATKKSH